jgi:hypothetical protein
MAGCELIALSIIAFLKKSTFSLKEIYSGVLLPFKIIPENSWKYLSNPTVSGEPIPFLYDQQNTKALTFLPSLYSIVLA